MAGPQPAWVRRRDVSERQTVAIGVPSLRSPSRATSYGRPPVWLIAWLTVLLPIVAFVLLLVGHTIWAAVLAVVAFVLAIAFGPETRKALRFAGFAGSTWSASGIALARLRLERRRRKRRLDAALGELGSATYEGDDERTRLAQACAHDAAAALARTCDEENRVLTETRRRVAERRIR